MSRARVAVAVRLVPARAEHVPELASRMRAIDRLECEAMGLCAEAALSRGLATSARTWTALAGDEVQAMFGVIVVSAADGDGIAWFLGSDQVGRHARLMVAGGPAVLAQMHCYARCLRNFVSAENRQAIRLLEHWGFTVEQRLVVVRSVAFRRFIRETK